MSLIKRMLLTLALCLVVLTVGLGVILNADMTELSFDQSYAKQGIRVEQAETDGVSFKVVPIAATTGTVGTQRVTATVTPSNALYDLEWMLSVGNSGITASEISDYLTISIVSKNSINLVCHAYFDGYAQLKCTDTLTNRSATATVSAWNFGTQYAQNANFYDSSGTKTYTYMGKDTDLMSNWYLTGLGAVMGGRFHVDPNNPGITVNNQAAASGSNWIYLVQTAPKNGTGATAPSRFQEGTEWYLVAEIDRSPGSIYTGNGDFTVLGQWYQNGIYIAKFEVTADIMTYKPFGIGFMSYVGMTGYSVEVSSIKLYSAGV